MLSERIFSTAGLLTNKLRDRLSSDIVGSVIFLNKNKVPSVSATGHCCKQCDRGVITIKVLFWHFDAWMII